jgi:outer membrane biogenesis lipoprotein LolB
MRTIVILCGVAAALLSGCGGDASQKPPTEAVQPVQITDNKRIRKQKREKQKIDERI